MPSPNLPDRRHLVGADVLKRLRALECDRYGCFCHSTARLANGHTHCPLHPLGAKPTLEVAVLLDGTLCLTLECDCDQARVWMAFLGNQVVAWEKARWDFLASASPPRKKESEAQGVDVY